MMLKQEMTKVLNTKSANDGKFLEAERSTPELPSLLFVSCGFGGDIPKENEEKTEGF